jgi:hypothetical protein
VAVIDPEAPLPEQRWAWRSVGAGAPSDAERRVP